MLRASRAVTFGKDLTSWVRLLSPCAFAFCHPVKSVPNFTPCKFKKTTSAEGRPWFYQLKSWRSLTQQLFCTHHGVFTPAELSGPLSIHLQWLSDKVRQRNKALPFACHAQRLRALNTRYKPKKPISTQSCNMDPGTSPHPAWDGRDLMRQRKHFSWDKSKGWAFTGMKETLTLGGTTYMLAHLGSYSPAPSLTIVWVEGHCVFWCFKHLSLNYNLNVFVGSL